MRHEAESLLGAYALGALDPDEQAELEEHLAGCEHCSSLLAEYQQVAEGLLTAVGSQSPSPDLRRRLAEAVAASAEPSPGAQAPETPPAAAPQRGPAARPRWRQLLRWPSAAWAGLGLVLVVINLVLVTQVIALSNRSQALLAQQRANQTALAVMSYPNSQVADLEQDSVRGSFVYDDQLPLAVLNVWGLPALESDQVYQLWLIDQAGDRTSGGTLAPTDDQEFVSLVVWAKDSFATVQGIGITVEPSGGSPSPTGPRVLAADLTHSP